MNVNWCNFSLVMHIFGNLCSLVTRSIGNNFYNISFVCSKLFGYLVMCSSKNRYDIKTWYNILYELTSHNMIEVIVGGYIWAARTQRVLWYTAGPSSDSRDTVNCCLRLKTNIRETHNVTCLVVQNSIKLISYFLPYNMFWSIQL